MRKEKLIIVFYILYFSWLTSLVYLIRNPGLLDYFTTGVAMFYFAFLREDWDVLWFLFGAFLVIFFVTSSFYNGIFQLNISHALDVSIWLPISWGTTFVALRKFFIVISQREDRRSLYY